ncbi:hypothetical protein WIW50_18745 [Flavobacteriaceae bacterium 3-367]|uniref:hypothetical protein n=1 Tax=Eudoraea algarum TaxID=3417568 RepID=UPI00326A83AC
MKQDRYRYYLRDLRDLIKERQQVLESRTDQDVFSKGIACGYNEVLQLFESQALTYEIDLKALDYDDFGFSPK